jgi:hypothetical protein
MINDDLTARGGIFIEGRKQVHNIDHGSMSWIGLDDDRLLLEKIK